MLTGAIAKGVRKGAEALLGRTYKAKQPRTMFKKKPKKSPVVKTNITKTGAKTVAAEAAKGAKRAVRGRRRGLEKRLAKRLIPRVSGVRKKLEGKSAADLAKQYTGLELTSMFRKLAEADKPNKKLLGRIKRARALREDIVSASESSTGSSSKTPLKFRNKGGKVIKKAHGGKMSHVALYPAEESRSGTMSEAKRKKYAKIGGVVKKKTGGVVKKQAGGPFKQGYKAREDESLGMRTGPESGKTQSMAARRDESYGDWGKRKRGRVNIKKGGSVRKLKKGGQVRKMSEGGMLVASLYETIS